MTIGLSLNWPRHGAASHFKRFRLEAVTDESQLAASRRGLTRSTYSKHPGSGWRLNWPRHGAASHSVDSAETEKRRVSIGRVTARPHTLLCRCLAPWPRRLNWPRHGAASHNTAVQLVHSQSHSSQLAASRRGLTRPWVVQTWSLPLRVSIGRVTARPHTKNRLSGRPIWVSIGRVTARPHTEGLSAVG